MRTHDVERLRRALIESSQAAFESLRLDLEFIDRAENEFACSAPVAAFVGFGGEALRGTVTMVGPFSLLCTMYPLRLKEQPEAALDVLDWTGEIANQLVGLLTNRLEREGLEVYASTPKVILTEHLAGVSLSRGSACELRFRAAPGDVGVWLDAAASKGGDLFQQPDSRGTRAGTGDLILF